MDLAGLFPDLKPWVDSLKDVWPAPVIKSSSVIFPIVQTCHLLAIATLGGCVLVPNLRLMGVGMTSVSPARLERSVRPLMLGALIVLLITGALMALVIAPRLYGRPAFLAKMIALAAALILSLGVVGPTAQRDGVLGQPQRILAGLALLLWLFAIYVFGWSLGSAPGTFHVICAAWLIVMAFGSRLTRIVLGAITAATVIGVGFVTYGLYTPLENYDVVMEINRWTLRIMAVVIAGFLLWELARPPAGDSSAAPGRLLGLFTILVWITVAAAGRWIGLGGGGA